MPKQGDILLIPVPFTDLSARKRRPVLVVSNDRYHNQTSDIVIVALTSNPKAAAYSFTITTDDLAKGNLKRPSRVRADKIYTLSQSIAIKIFGRVKPSVLQRVREQIQELMAAKRT